MYINHENIYLGSDEEEVSDVTGISEGIEEYGIDKLSALSFRHLSFDLAPTSASNEENETSSVNISTDVPSFRSSSSLNSTLAPASWPSDMSDFYLQTSDNSSCPKSNTSSLEINEQANSPECFPRSIKRISKPKMLPNKPADKRRNIVKSKKSVKHPFLYDILGGDLLQIPSTKVHYLEYLKVSISKCGSHLGSQGLSLPEDGFAGYFTLNIEDTTDGMFIESNMNFKEDSFTIDVNLFSKLTKDFKLIEEKRTESMCNDYEHKKTESNNLDNSKFAACYLPQPNDNVPSKDHLQPMGPVSYWATGKVDWSPLAGLTGTRPVVDRYSITRFSTNEWRAKNKEIIDNVSKVLTDTDKNAYNSKATMARTFALVEKTQAESTANMKERAKLLNKWKTTLERTISAMIDELAILEEERVRVKKSLVILGIPESIAKECIEKRAGRPETELVRDNPQEELVKELALISEIRTTLKKTLADIEEQQIENRTARQRLEYDWSDKKESYELESINCGLNNNSTTIMFRPGVTRMPAEQASEQFWEHFTKETLEECEKCRLKSITLRGTLASILLNAARDLRTQADIVEKAMVCRINCTQENVQQLENELRECLNKLADTETRIDKMFRAVRSFDGAMKVAHTRLDNRSYRPHVENCRDRAQSGLIDEVSTIQNGVSGMLAALREAENIKNQLMQTRGRLEREIMLKRRTLMLDRERCMLLRSHYPSATALSVSVNM